MFGLVFFAFELERLRKMEEAKGLDGCVSDIELFLNQQTDLLIPEATLKRFIFDV